jgi:hypothetical protein
MNYTEALIKARKARVEAKQATDLYRAQISAIRPRLEALEAEKRGTRNSNTSPHGEQVKVTRDGKISRW